MDLTNKIIKFAKVTYKIKPLKFNSADEILVGLLVKFKMFIMRNYLQFHIRVLLMIEIKLQQDEGEY